MKIQRISFLTMGLLLLITACERSVEDELDVIELGEETLDMLANIEDHDAPTDYIWDEDDVLNIVLKGNTADSDDDGVMVDGSIVTIIKAATYRIEGELYDGQIIVDTEDDSLVRIILDGVSISCSSNAPLYVKNSKKVMIVLAENSQNFISDGVAYSSDETDANAAVYSEENLTIYGDGTLTVDAKYNDGITSKDGLVIAGGNLIISAVDDGMRGKDYIYFKTGTVSIVAGGDGLKSDNDEDSGAGYITIEDGIFDIVAEGDGIQAESNVLISDGTFNLQSGGGSNAYLYGDVSAKGIKSGVSIFIAGGTFNVGSADDAIHSDGDIAIEAGSFTIATADDGIHADGDVFISGGEINITEAYEGLESALGKIVISDGIIYIVSSDDGINVSAGGGNNGGGPGFRSATTSEYALLISGGYIVLDSDGDGLDSNDQMDISGGTILVNGPSANSNSALDYDGECTISDGFLVAVGSSNMAEAPGTNSSQYSLLINFRSGLSAGNIVNIVDEDGERVLTFKTIKAFQSIAFSSPDLKKGSSYNVYLGGSSSGTVVDGLITDGTYSGGTLYTSFTISSIVTTKNL